MATKAQEIARIPDSQMAAIQLLLQEGTARGLQHWQLCAMAKTLTTRHYGIGTLELNRRAIYKAVDDAKLWNIRTEVLNDIPLGSAGDERNTVLRDAIFGELAKHLISGKKYRSATWAWNDAKTANSLLQDCPPITLTIMEGLLPTWAGTLNHLAQIAKDLS